MKKLLLLVITLALFLLGSFSSLWSIPGSGKGLCQVPGRYPIMRPDSKTLKKWQDSYHRAPRAVLDRKNYARFGARGDLSLLSHISYVPEERNQGTCGNCWAWAGTGCLEIALDVQEAIKNRLSIQYINSCETQLIGKTRCDGGWLNNVSDFYNQTKKTVPWTNTNADWHDGDESNEITCQMVSTSPSYPVTSIDAQTIETQSVSQATAIANIKNMLNQNKGVWFGFFLPNQVAWDDFFDFWDNPGETTVYDIDKYSGLTYDPNTSGGHAVLCIGYNDTDPNNSYWIMLNSWGTSLGSRPNGLFRINMNMDYGASYYFSEAFYWQDLAVNFNPPPAPVLNGLTLADRASGSLSYTCETTVNVTVNLSGTPEEIGFSSNSDFSGAAWQAYQAANTCVLPVGDGQKTIYCRVRNAGGESVTRSASIYLDSTSPAVNLTLNDIFLKSGDYINSLPELKAVITEGVGVQESSLKITRDGLQINDGQSGGGRYDSYDLASQTLIYTFKNNLPSGAHLLIFQVADLAGNATTLNYSGLTVAEGLALTQVLNYPNPFSTSTYFSYQLSQDADISIKVFSSRGQLLKTLAAAAGTPGGRQGFNQLAWDGADAGGTLLPNGMYLYLLTAADSSGQHLATRGSVGISR